ncbi:MAG: hypothetical protein ACKVRP_06620 [Bacteroidota bacterium]
MSTLVLTLALTSSTLLSQYSDRQYRRTGILNGNQVRTVFGNWGVIGQPAEQGKRGAWKDDNNGYLGDVSPIVGAEVRWRDTSFHAVILSPVARPQTAPRSEDPVTGKPWAFEPVPGYFADAPNQSIAISNNPSSWPLQWPDKLGDPSDPGWEGSWNGYFGKRVSADLETYFVLDDQNFERFNDSINNARRVHFRPDSNNVARKGLGLVMKVRGLQWAQFLAQDNIFWLYEITNTGTTTYDRAVFGMLVGTYVGVTSTENAGEFNDDWSFFDVFENITYTGDFGRNTTLNPRWNQTFRVGMVGYAFLESPGNPFDGIDNDGDADSSTAGLSAPVFNPAAFDSLTIQAGSTIILIRDDFSRYSFVVPNDTVTVYSRGRYTLITPGVTRVVEGNEYFAGAYNINRNAYDGVDNDFDGLIDENYYLHYRQIKRQANPNLPPLIDLLRPVRYVNFRTGAGTDPLSMIEEKRNDLIDNDFDWSRNPKTGQPIFDSEGNLLDDVGRDGITRTNDFGERDGQPTSGYTASGFDSGLPGEPNVDKTDVNESDQIGLSSFNYFEPSNGISFGSDEALWGQVAPGFFSVPSSIINNRPQAGADGDFLYSSGYFPLVAGATERFSLALVYGGGKGGTLDNDITDLLRNKKTVQQIYDANYQFPTPPDKPTLTAVADDRKVTLYWDRRAENSIDPVLKVNDFQGYKIYKSTDPNFSDIYTITDGSGTPRGYRPIVQYDLEDNISGYFQATGELFEASQGYNIFLGENTGLQHSFVDLDVENGRTYYYAIVAYDKGDDSAKVFPSENTKQVTVLTTGTVTTDINVVRVVPNTKSAGYIAPQTGLEVPHLVQFGTGSINYDVIDPTKVTGNTYTVTFSDTRYDGIDNNGNGIFDDADSTEWDRRTSFYYVKDNATYTELFVPSDTILVPLSRKNLDLASVIVTTEGGAPVDPGLYSINPELGAIRASTSGSLPDVRYRITYQYYPVFRSPTIKDSPFVNETRDAEIFDGVQLDFSNDWSIVLTNADSIWTRTAAYLVSFTPIETELGPGQVLRGYREPADYEIEFFDTIVDTSTADPFLFIDAIPVNFRIFNPTDNEYVDFIFAEATPNAGSTGKVSPQDEIVFFDRRLDGSFVYSWDVRFTAKPNDPPDTVYNLTVGDKLVLKTSKPFREGDVFQFTTVKPKVEVAAENRSSMLDRIKVVPNPYVTASSFEAPLPPGITGGRGQRKIDFTHLPANATIRIFTSRGDHIVTLSHDGDIEDGTVSWNLKTKENLDIAYGVYFYVVESQLGKKTGKIAIIK